MAEWQILLFGLLTATLPENRQICQRRPAKTGVHFTVDRAGFFWLFGQSAIVHNGQFTVNFSPVLNRHRPLFRGFKCGQIKRFKKSGIAGENAPLPIQFPVSGVQAFNRICGVDYLANVRREFKDGQMTSQLSYQRFMARGYFSSHFSVTSSSASRPSFSEEAL